MNNNLKQSILSKLTQEELAIISFKKNPDSKYTPLVPDSRFKIYVHALQESIVNKLTQEEFSNIRFRKLDKISLVHFKNRPIHDNCRIYAPDGQQIACASTDRINWYIKKGLGEAFGENGVRLLFEPKSRGDGKFDFRDNICVVCGNPEYLQRHHVIPYSFGRYLPRHLINHNSHDILATCKSCHERYERFSDIKREELAIRYGIDYKALLLEQKTICKRMYKICGLSRAYLNESKCPKEKILSMLTEVLGKEPTTEEMQHFSMMKINKKTLQFKTLSEEVVARVTDIQGFIEEWRKHFVEVMQPKYLPMNWSINKKVKCDI